MTWQRRPARRISMCVWGDTMHAVHITVKWIPSTIQTRMKEEVAWFWTRDEMVPKLRQRLERYLK
jgi:hypothetical protein